MSLWFVYLLGVLGTFSEDDWETPNVLKHFPGLWLSLKTVNSQMLAGSTAPCRPVGYFGVGLWKVSGQSQVQAWSLPDEDANQQSSVVAFPLAGLGKVIYPL